MLHFLIRIYDSPAVGVIDIADWEREAQFSSGSSVFLAADHPGMQEVQFGLAHGPFQADKKTVIKIRHVVDAIFVDHKGVKQAAQLKELHQVSR